MAKVMMFRCVGRVRMSGQVHADGTEVEANPEDVADAIDIGSLVEVGEAEEDGSTLKGSAGANGSSSSGPRVPELPEIVAAIETLKLADFTVGKNARPKTEAIEAVIEGDVKVSATLRNDAWASMVEGGAVVPTA